MSTTKFNDQALQMLGWAWAEACAALDEGEDPRSSDLSVVLAVAEDDFFGGEDNRARGTTEQCIQDLRKVAGVMASRYPSALCINAADRLEQLKAENEQLRRERDAWMESAAQMSRNRDFYHGIVVQVGELFGVAAKTSDDGSIQQDVLALKVFELVEQLQAENERLEKLLTKVSKVLSGGIAGDGKPLSLDTYQERNIAALAYMETE